MAWTQTDLDAIEKSIASGARRVRFQTHEVEYHSLDEMLKARSLIRDEIAAASGCASGALFTEYSSGA